MAHNDRGRDYSEIYSNAQDTHFRDVSICVIFFGSISYFDDFFFIFIFMIQKPFVVNTKAIQSITESVKLILSIKPKILLLLATTHCDSRPWVL